jgi:hypothetical protein
MTRQDPVPRNYSEPVHRVRARISDPPPADVCSGLAASQVAADAPCAPPPIPGPFLIVSVSYAGLTASLWPWADSERNGARFRVANRSLSRCSFEQMQFRILGPLGVADGDRLICSQGRSGRLALLRRANEVVSAGRLINQLGDEAPGQDGPRCRCGVAAAKGAAETAGGLPPAPRDI